MPQQTEISYFTCNKHNFDKFSLDTSIRKQTVTHCWRKTRSGYMLQPVAYTEDWNLNERRAVAAKICDGLQRGCLAFAAAQANRIVGFAYVDRTFFGNKHRYVALEELYVSQPFRNRGIGRQLFVNACSGARSLGATRLYISAHSAEEVIAAYRRFGCEYAEEINQTLAEKEPCDLPLAFNLETHIPH